MWRWAFMFCSLAPMGVWAKSAAKYSSDVTAAPDPVTITGTLAVLSLVPFAFIMLTSFSKIAVVLSLARSAMGTQQAPPSVVLTGLAAVLTGYIMAPVFESMYERSQGAMQGKGSGTQTLKSLSDVAEPLKQFLSKHASSDEKARFVDLSREMRGENQDGELKEEDLIVVIPAFVLTELKEAFQIGFLLFLPFLVLDMLVANVLLALGMQTLSPSQVSLPFKILLFVAVDGWGLLASGIILGYR